jgi:hypothetical protein
MIKKTVILALCALGSLVSENSFSQAVTININATSAKKHISPYIYGKNNTLSDDNTSSLSGGLTAAQWQRLRDMGITMFRDNGGNNSTKYNWRLKLSSHPDWYNNVYKHDWDFAARGLQESIPSAQGMWTFQLIGKAAKTTANNFNDWSYNGSQWWTGCSYNLCGGGTLNSNNEVVKLGDPSLYLENWNADSTTGILDHWFGANGIGLNPKNFQYWDMDNEPEIWDGTHDDVYPVQPEAETFMQTYFAVAKKAREKYPDIKLMGPVPANEWQWYNWKGDKISYNGKTYTWLEYFIMRVAEEQKATGIRLLDVLDVHFYPSENNAADMLQVHRVFFDETYDYPGANGVKRVGAGGWDNSITKEYIFKRCKDWLGKYMGPDNGVTLSVSECSLADHSSPNVTATWYASMLGEFARQGVEIFTPWDWYTGMSEVVHVFSKYYKEYYVEATSSDEEYVSAYPTMNYNSDSMTIFLVNRELTNTRTVTLNLSGYAIDDGTYRLYSLSGLPSAETFVSATSNALKSSTVTVSDNKIILTLPALSTSAVVLKRSPEVYNQFGELLLSAEAEQGVLTGVIDTAGLSGYSGTGYVTSLDTVGNNVKVKVSIPSTGIYKVVIRYLGTKGVSTQKVMINNDFSALVSFPATTDYSCADAGNMVMNAGNNTVTISHDTGTCGIDRVDIYRVEKKTYNIAPLVDTVATEATKALYEFLQYQFGNRIISGQTHDYYTQLESIADKSPLLSAGDLTSYSSGYPYAWDNNTGSHIFGAVDNGTVSSLISWYNSTGKKGIVALHWHWCAPNWKNSAGVNTFYTENTNFDIRLGVTPGTAEYDSIISNIDAIAFQLKKFQDAGVPVLWRPLHEASGGWFWWGAHGAEPCLKLYDIMYDRLTNYHHLHNLIWEWSSIEPSWYPGNDKVDLVGYDSYPGNYSYVNQKSYFDKLYMLTRGKKMIALTENGPIPDPDACLADGDAPWLYFMSWSNLVASQNTTAHIQDVYNNTNVLTLESTQAKTGFDWRSSLYPADWKPGYKDSEGRFLHDFSYAGYHAGIEEVPHITKNVVDVTQAPYNADNTGTSDVTAILQQALDDVGQAGGGVVYLPSGTFKVSASDNSYALKIAYDSTVLRGAGSGLTHILNTSTSMRYKDIISVAASDADWFNPTKDSSYLRFDIIEPTRTLPVESVAGFSPGDLVIVTSTPSDEFISEHYMTGYWTASAIKGVAFMRTIDSIDTRNNLIIIDAPTRYALKTRDYARVYKINPQISECGIEYLSLGNVQNTLSGWDDLSYAEAGTGAYEVHYSQAIHLKDAINCWVQHVSTFRPEENTNDYHLLSNGLRLNQCRFVTVDSCTFEKSQYEGEGGNGYLFTLESNDCLIKNSRANHGRHNFDFKYPYSNGNVILQCRTENSKYGSDFHMYLSMANLFDDCVVNSDYLESVFRPYGTCLHGYTSTQSVFYNTTGEAYHEDKDYLIDSRQFGMGYVIGTSGAASSVVTYPADGTKNGYLYSTSPRDFTEGIGTGQYLEPASLYLDQLERRKKSASTAQQYHVNIVVKDATGALVEGCTVQIYNDTVETNTSGVASFEKVPEFFILNLNKKYYVDVNNLSYFIYSDTTLSVTLERKAFDVTIKLLRAQTYDVLSYVSVVFNSVTGVTNSSGAATFSVYGGSHDYSINKVAYRVESGTLLVESDTTFTFYLVQTSATVRFKLLKGTTPVDQATIILADKDTLISNTMGMATFGQLPVSTQYDYLISRNGYYQQQGSFYLKRDTVITLSMTINTSVDQNMENNRKIEYWPNPVHNILQIHITGDISNYKLKITDLRGVDIYRQDVEKSDFAINLSALPAGTYLLQLVNGNVRSVYSLIKQ